MSETKRTAAQIRAYCEAVNKALDREMIVRKRSALFVELGLYARTDLPRVLDKMERYRDAAVKLWEMLDDVMCYAIDAGRRSDYERAHKLWLETAWLADSPDPPLSPGGESVKLWPWENSLGLYRAGIDGEQAPIWSLFPNVRISNCLARQGITKTGQARWLLETYGDDGLLWIRGLGTISLLRLKEALTLPDGESGEESET